MTDISAVPVGPPPLAAAGAAAAHDDGTAAAAAPGPMQPRAVGPHALFHQLEEVDVSGDNWTSPLPLGPPGLVTHGKLSNGLTYYVQPCAKPAGRAALALVVRCGSVLEEEAERGVAHIVEHLAFNATQRYANHEIVRFLESIGAQFGACQNAYTGTDETVYQLSVPTDGTERLGGTEGAADGSAADPAQPLRQALDVLAQFAFAIRCDPADLAKERGAVMEELRMARDASGRSQEAHWKLVMHGSRYADRLPIGTEAVIRGVPAPVVRAFYQRWYRPELMAVVVVGDLPAATCGGPDQVVHLIRQAFEVHHGKDAPAAAAAGEASSAGAVRTLPTSPDVPLFPHVPHSSPRVKVFVDREASSPAVYASYKHPRQPLACPADYLTHLEASLFQEVLHARLFKRSRELDPPLLSGGVSCDEPLTRATSSCVLSATALEGGALRALEALLTEVARVRLHGITPREFNRALADLRADVENTYREADHGYAADLRDELVRHFLDGEFVTGPVYEARLSKTLLGRCDRHAVARIADRFRPSDSCVIKVVEHRKRTTEAAIQAVVARVAAAEAAGAIPPFHRRAGKSSEGKWNDEEEGAAADDDEGPGSSFGGNGGGLLPQQLLPAAQAPVLADSPAGITRVRAYAELGAKELTLGNGLTLLLKPTAHMADEVLITGTATGGLSEVPPEAHYTAACAGVVAGQLGIFGLRPSLLHDLLAGSAVEVGTSEGAFSRAFRASCSPGDLEVALQLVHRLFTTHVQVDEAELRVVVRMLHDTVRAQARNPVSHFSNRVRAVNYGDCAYFTPMGLRDVARVDLRGACAHHNASFCNPAEFRVVLTGNIDEVTLTPLALQYLATLPARDTPRPRALAEVTPLRWSPPTAPLVEDVPVPMVSPITQAQVTFPVALSGDGGPGARRDAVWLSLLCQLLETRLMQRLRFQFGEIYTVSVSTFFGCEAPSNLGAGPVRGDVAISFTCDPANRHRLIELALAEVEAVQGNSRNSAGRSPEATQSQATTVTQQRPVSDEEVATVVRLARLQQAELEQENAYWHDLAVSGYQSKTYAMTGDLDEVVRRARAAREEVLAAATPEQLTDAARRLLPYPCRSCYTALAMVPRQAWWAGRRRWLLPVAALLVVSASVALGAGLIFFSERNRASDNGSSGRGRGETPGSRGNPPGYGGAAGSSNTGSGGGNVT